MMSRKDGLTMMWMNYIRIGLLKTSAWREQACPVRYGERTIFCQYP